MNKIELNHPLLNQPSEEHDENILAGLGAERATLEPRLLYGRYLALSHAITNDPGENRQIPTDKIPDPIKKVISDANQSVDAAPKEVMTQVNKKTAKEDTIDSIVVYLSKGAKPTVTPDLKGTFFQPGKSPEEVLNHVKKIVAKAEEAMQPDVKEVERRRMES